MKIAFIGFGEAARSFVETLAKRTDDLSFAAYDIRQDAAMDDAMQSRNVRIGRTPASALDGADWIFSAVTADQSLIAAQAAAPAVSTGQCFIDINSVSPDRKRATAALIERAGGLYVDMAVMAPVHPRGHATPVLLAGSKQAIPESGLSDLGFSFQIVGVDAGAATAIKMVRSLFVKGLEAITVEALIAAAASGCFDQVYESLSASFPALGWPDQARYNFERTLLHGGRRAAEMRESAATLNALGLTGGLADKIADVQDSMGRLDAVDLTGDDLKTAITEIARLRAALD